SKVNTLHGALVSTHQIRGFSCPSTRGCFDRCDLFPPRASHIGSSNLSVPRFTSLVPSAESDAASQHHVLRSADPHSPGAAGHPEAIHQGCHPHPAGRPAAVVRGCHHKRYVELTDLEQKWKNLCLPKEKFKALLQLDPCENKIKWINFLALGCSMLGGSLNTALKHLCEILTDDPEGGPARIPFKTFSYVYRYLARLDSDVSPLETDSYLASLKESVDAKKNGMIGLSDFFFPKRKLLENLENSEDVGH
uniref:Rhophilin associated tail protein 1 like n=1 Tax=Pongo abelii TaxID=9601 RepID=A0A8I5UDZ6_PONAB